MADNVLRVKVNGIIGFSLIGLITYLYKFKEYGVSWDWPLRVGPFMSGPFVSGPFTSGPFVKGNRLMTSLIITKIDH